MHPTTTSNCSTEPTTGNFAELADVAGPDGGAVPDDGELAARLDGRASQGVILEVGVGANDREAFQLIHGHLPTVDALAGVVDAVATHRSANAPQHPLNRMAPERFLRWRIEQDPGLVGLVRFEQRDPPIDRVSMKHTEACLGRGVDAHGSSALVAVSVGGDLDLVPFLADALVSLDRTVDHVVVALPERDALAITRDLVALLERDVTVRVVPEAS